MPAKDPLPRAVADVLTPPIGTEPSADESYLEMRIRTAMVAGRISRRNAIRIVSALADERGPVEHEVRRSVAALAVLTGTQAAYAQVAYRLARALDIDDSEGITGLSGASRELRAALVEIWKGVKVPKNSDQLGSLADAE